MFPDNELRVIWGNSSHSCSSTTSKVCFAALVLTSYPLTVPFGNPCSKIAASRQLMDRRKFSYARVTDRRARWGHPEESNSLNPESRREGSPLKLFVGIDVSSEELEACFMDPEGDTLETLKVENNLHGASHLRDRIVAAADKLPASEIHIGLEATSVYSWHPAMYLHEDASLQERKTKVLTINPKLINKFKEAYADMDKTDRIDAWMIADRLRFGRLTTTIVM